jgi:hypothetical protein
MVSAPSQATVLVGIAVIMVAATGCGRDDSAITAKPDSRDSNLAAKSETAAFSEPSTEGPTKSDSSMSSTADNVSESSDVVESTADVPSHGPEMSEQVSVVPPQVAAPDSMKRAVVIEDAVAASDDAPDDAPQNDSVSEIPLQSTTEPDGTAAPLRILLPMTDRVLLVDVDVRIGDSPLAQAFSRQIAAVMTEARGKEGTSGPTWQELFAHVQADPERFGRRQPINAGQYDELIRRYDRNRNRRTDDDEVARFLFRASGSAEPFRLIGTDHFRHVNRSDSKLFRDIDSDGNGLLDSTELDHAAGALIRMDQNADRGLSLSEANVSQQDNGPAWNRRRTHRRGSVAMDLQGYVDWTMVSYAMDGWIGDSSVNLDALAVAAIDSDGDGSVSRQEAASLRDIVPDLSLLVQFAENGLDEAMIDVVSMRPDLESVTRIAKSSRSITLSGQSLQLSFEILDSPTRQNAVPPQAFAMLDSNGDGFLEESEIPQVALSELSLESLDADNDGKLTLGEINRGRASATPIWTTQVRGRAAEFPDAIFAWLDRNQDRFLSEREILAAGERLGQGGGLPLSASDIPESFVVQIARGDPGQDNQTFRFSKTREPKSDSMPTWAGHMDSNGDGHISRLEFIGTSDQFDGFDENSDGFIDGQEVAAWGDKGHEG